MAEKSIPVAPASVPAPTAPAVKPSLSIVPGSDGMVEIRIRVDPKVADAMWTEVLARTPPVPQATADMNWRNIVLGQAAQVLNRAMDKNSLAPKDLAERLKALDALRKFVIEDTVA